jgi:hypothetical protein
MKFIKIFTNKTATDSEIAVNEFAKSEKLEILSANTIINQGVIYTTVIFDKHNTAKVKKTENVGE